MTQPRESNTPPGWEGQPLRPRGCAVSIQIRAYTAGSGQKQLQSTARTFCNEHALERYKRMEEELLR